MSRPRLLDAFCGAGGAGMGYYRAGFDVTGVDIKPMPNNPHTFIQADALEYIAAHGREYDAIHASPPCQAYSRMRHLPWLTGKEYPLLIDPVRDLLNATGRPWVIENVADAPLRNGVILCGPMFGLKVYRHRKFESNVMLLSPPHSKHREVIGAGRLLNDRAQPNGNGWVTHLGKSPDASAAAMGIDWMTGAELSQAIPPAYCNFIGLQLIAYLRNAAGEPAGSSLGHTPCISACPDQKTSYLPNRDDLEGSESCAHSLPEECAAIGASSRP